MFLCLNHDTRGNWYERVQGNGGLTCQKVLCLMCLMFCLVVSNLMGIYDSLFDSINDSEKSNFDSQFNSQFDNYALESFHHPLVQEKGKKPSYLYPFTVLGNVDEGYTNAFSVWFIVKVNLSSKLTFFSLWSFHNSQVIFFFTCRPQVELSFVLKLYCCLGGKVSVDDSGGLLRACI